MEDIFSILTRHLQDPETGWSIGTFGALAEFHWEPDEIKKIMEGCIEFKVPFVVDKKLGDSWGNAK